MKFEASRAKPRLEALFGPPFPTLRDSARHFRLRRKWGGRRDSNPRFHLRDNTLNTPLRRVNIGYNRTSQETLEMAE
jgi:hypothetical protein